MFCRTKEHTLIMTLLAFSLQQMSKFICIRGTYGGNSASWFWNICTKFAFTFDADIPVIRTPEMILIEAEAKYHNGDEAGAHDLLYALQLNRDPDAIKSANTGLDLFGEILVKE